MKLSNIEIGILGYYYSKNNFPYHKREEFGPMYSKLVKYGLIKDFTDTETIGYFYNNKKTIKGFWFLFRNNELHHYDSDATPS